MALAMVNQKEAPETSSASIRSCIRSIAIVSASSPYLERSVAAVRYRSTRLAIGRDHSRRNTSRKGLVDPAWQNSPAVFWPHSSWQFSSRRSDASGLRFGLVPADAGHPYGPQMRKPGANPPRRQGCPPASARPRPGFRAPKASLVQPGRPSAPLVLDSAPPLHLSLGSG